MNPSQGWEKKMPSFVQRTTQQSEMRLGVGVVEKVSKKIEKRLGFIPEFISKEKGLHSTSVHLAPTMARSMAHRMPDQQKIVIGLPALFPGFRPTLRAHGWFYT